MLTQNTFIEATDPEHRLQYLEKCPIVKRFYGPHTYINFYWQN